MGRRAALLCLASALHFVLAAAPSPSTFEEDLAIPAGVVWSHPIGDAKGATPRCRGRCVDDGVASGAPLGGMGAGTVGRTYRGDFARWHLRPGTHIHAPAMHTFTAVNVEGQDTVLSSYQPHGDVFGEDSNNAKDDANANETKKTRKVPQKRRTLPSDGTGGTYSALYPRSWYTYNAKILSKEGDVKLAQTQFSPILPGKYKESSLPVFCVKFLARNDGESPKTVSLLLQFENPLRVKELVPLTTSGKTSFTPHTSTVSHEQFSLTSEKSKTKTKGVHVFSENAYGQLPSKPWHGGFSIATEDTDDVDVTMVSNIFHEHDASKVWDAFERNGALDETENNKQNVPADAELAAVAVCVTFTLRPGEVKSVPFAVGWDLPVVSFENIVNDNEDSDVFKSAFVKQHVRYHKAISRSVGFDHGPPGGAAPLYATFALDNLNTWETAIEAWQQPYVDSGVDTDMDTEMEMEMEMEGTQGNRKNIRRPNWFVSALFNSLYHLVDAGTVWGRPLSVSGLDGLGESFIVGMNGETAETAETRYDPSTRSESLFETVGNGGVWGGSYGRFGLAKSFDQPTYNAVPSYFYGSWSLAKFWPLLDLSVVADLCNAVDVEDDNTRHTQWGTGVTQAMRSSEKTDSNKTSLSTAPKRRKVKYAAPHDLGSAVEFGGKVPLVSSANAHATTDVNTWVDLAPKLALLVTRAHVFSLENSEKEKGLDDVDPQKSVLRKLFSQAYVSLSELIRLRDVDGDGIIEHLVDSTTQGPDYMFDRWAAGSGAKGAYTGGLWLASLRAFASIASVLGEVDAASSLDAAGRNGARALNEALWVPFVDDTGDTDATGDIKNKSKNLTGYYRHDDSNSNLGNASIATQVIGEWVLGTLGLAPAHPPHKTRAALETILRVNGVTKSYKNGTTASHESSNTSLLNAVDVDTLSIFESNLHSAESWPTFAYVVAAHALSVVGGSVGKQFGEESEKRIADDLEFEKLAWSAARRAYETTWQSGFAFRTPEAVDGNGRFRGASDIKGGAVWALDRALEMRHKERKTEYDAQRKGKETEEDRDEL